MSNTRNMVHKLHALKSLLPQEATDRAKAVVRDPKVWRAVLLLIVTALLLLLRMPSGLKTPLVTLIMAALNTWAIPQKQIGQGEA